MQLNVRDAARLLHASERTVYRWMKERGLPHSKVQEQTRFNRVELLEWATRHGIQVSPEVFVRQDGHGSAPPLADALEAGGIHHGLPGNNREEVTRSLVSALRLPPDLDRDFVLAALMARENAGSTAVGGGVAIPHVRNPVVLPLKAAQAALGFLASPVDFGAEDRKPVFAIFALLCPTIRAHLQLVSKLAYVLGETSVRKTLERKAPPPEILAAIREEEAKFQAAEHGGAGGAAPPG